MGKCKNCERKVCDDAMLCCHCGYPITVARVVPWPRQHWPVKPQQFWKAIMLVSLLFAILSAVGTLVNVFRGLSCLYFGYLLLLTLSVFFWAYLGSRQSLR